MLLLVGFRGRSGWVKLIRRPYASGSFNRRVKAATCTRVEQESNLPFSVLNVVLAYCRAPYAKTVKWSSRGRIKRGSKEKRWKRNAARGVAKLVSVNKSKIVRNPVSHDCSKEYCKHLHFISC